MKHLDGHSPTFGVLPVFLPMLFTHERSVRVCLLGAVEIYCIFDDLLVISIYCELVCSLINTETAKLLFELRQNSFDVIGTEKSNLIGSEPTKLQCKVSHLFARSRERERETSEQCKWSRRLQLVSFVTALIISEM